MPLGRELFEEIMPQLVKKYDPDRIFHPSSPWGVEDWHNGNSPHEGDWHDYATIRFMPQSTVPLFTTEVCMVSPYSVNSMRRFMSEEELWPKDFSFKIDKPGKIAWPEEWEYHTTGNGWQKLGSIQDYLDVQNVDDLWTEKFLNLPDASIQIEKATDGIILKSDKFVKVVALTIPNSLGAVFDDNYFNLLPGETKHVKILDSANGTNLVAKGVNSSEVEISLNE